MSSLITLGECLGFSVSGYGAFVSGSAESPSENRYALRVKIKAVEANNKIDTDKNKMSVL